MGIYANQVQALYVAYFNRPADPVGLAYWEKQLASGATDIATVAKEFGTQPEYTSAFTGKTTAQIINNIYVNLFGHNADTDGLLYWADLITSKVITLDVAVTKIVEGAQGTDKVAYDSKVSAAVAFTEALVLKDGGTAAYSGDAAALVAKAYLAGVTDTTSLTAAKAALPTTLDSIASANDPLLAASIKAQAAVTAANTAATEAVTKATSASTAVTTAEKAKADAIAKAAQNDAEALKATSDAAAETAAAAVTAKTEADTNVVNLTKAASEALAAGDQAAYVAAQQALATAKTVQEFAAANAKTTADAAAAAKTAADNAAADDAAVGTTTDALTKAIADAGTAAAAATKAAADAKAAADLFTAAAGKTTQVADDNAAVTAAATATKAVTDAANAAGVVAVINGSAAFATAATTATTDATAATTAHDTATAAIGAVKDATTAAAAVTAAADALAAATKANVSAQTALQLATSYDAAAKATTTTADDAAAAKALSDATTAATAAANALATATADKANADKLPAGYVAQTFTLTAGVDSGAAFTGAGGDDIFNATGATLSALDAIDGKGGTNTLNIQDPSGLLGTTLPAGVSITNIQKMNVSTSGNLGQVTVAPSAAVPAVKQVQSINLSAISPTATGTITVTYGASTYTTINLDGTAVDAAEVNGLLVSAINTMAGSTVATIVNGVVIVTAPVAGVALPTIGTTVNTPGDVTIGQTTVTENAVEIPATTGSTAATYDVSGVTGLTNFVGSAIGVVDVKLADTTDGTLTSTAAKAMNVAGGKNLTLANGAGAIAVTGAAGLTSVSVTGGTTVNIADNGTEADTLTTVSVKGNTGAVAIGSDALTTLNIGNTNQSVTVTAAAGTRALTVGIDKVTGGTIQDAEATSLVVNATGTKSSGITLTAAKATTLAINGDVAVATALGAQAANLAITVGNSAGVTISTVLSNDVSFTGGAGADSIQIGATSKAISTGAGDDTVVFGAAAVAAGGSINGGAGTDTLQMTAANAATASSTVDLGTAFKSTVTNFEKLVLATVTTNTVDVGRLGFTDISSSGATALTLNGVTSGSTLRFTGAAAVGGTTTVASTTALANGTADVLNVALTGVTTAGNVNFGTLTGTDVESYNVSTNYDASMTAGNKTTALGAGFANQLTIDGNQAKSIVVTGAAGLNLDAQSTALTSLDASGITVGATGEFSWTAGALAASSVIKGAASATNTINLNAANVASTFVTYVGGSGADIVDASSSNKNNVFTLAGGNNNLQSGDGNNTVTLVSDGVVAVANGATGNKVVLGNGNNTVTDTGTKGVNVTVGTGANTITTGSGDDFITLGQSGKIDGLNKVNLGSGTDTVVFANVTTSAGKYSSLSGFGTGDKIDLVGASAATIADIGNGFKAAITLGASSNFANYLDAASAGTTVGALNWFQFNGNTYLVLDNSPNTTYADGVDMVIEIVGTVNLAAATTHVTNEILTLG